MKEREITLSTIDRMLLRAMAHTHESGGSQTSASALRMALRESGLWRDTFEVALCNAGNEDPLVEEYYTALRRLALDTPFAEGRGNLRLPAGPRYTECGITPAGLAEIARLDGQTNGNAG